MSDEENDKGPGRVRRYDESRRGEGLKRVSVWVPEDKVETLKLTAAAWRKNAGQKLPTDGKAPAVRPKAPRPLEPSEHRPEPGRWSYVRLEPDELAIRLALKANDGRWVSNESAEFMALVSLHGMPGGMGVWCMRADLVERPGLTRRVAVTVKNPPMRGRVVDK